MATEIRTTRLVDALAALTVAFPRNVSKAMDAAAAAGLASLKATSKFRNRTGALRRSFRAAGMRQGLNPRIVGSKDEGRSTAARLARDVARAQRGRKRRALRPSPYIYGRFVNAMPGRDFRTDALKEIERQFTMRMPGILGGSAGG